MRLKEAKEALERAKALDNRVIVALSGGKDSLATLDLCSSVFPKGNIKAFFMYLVPGLRCIEDPVDSIARRYGIEVIKLPHWGLQEHLRKGIYAAQSRNWGTRQTSFKDVVAYVRKLTGYQWIAIGQRMTDSFMRRWYLAKVGPVDETNGYLYPMVYFRQSEVIEYLQARKIPLPPKLGQDKNRVTGVDLRPATVEWIKENHPKDYQRICNFFPLIEAMNVRKELTANG